MTSIIKNALDEVRIPQQERRKSVTHPTFSFIFESREQTHAIFCFVLHLLYDATPTQYLLHTYYVLSVWGQQNKLIPAHFSLLKNTSDQKKLLE